MYLKSYALDILSSLVKYMFMHCLDMVWSLQNFHVTN